MKNIILLIILILLNLILFNKDIKVERETIIETKTDTILQIDTIVKEKLVPQKVIQTSIDTIYINDTVFIQLPIETKIYKDSTYEAQISGFKPNLDYFKVYPRTIYITNEKVSEIKSERLTHGIQGGVGYGLMTKKPDIWIGYGFQLNF